MFGPRDQLPPQTKQAKTFQLVFEDGKPFVVVSFGSQDDWIKVSINDDQLWHFCYSAVPRLRGR